MLLILVAGNETTSDSFTPDKATPSDKTTVGRPHHICRFRHSPRLGAMDPCNCATLKRGDIQRMKIGTGDTARQRSSGDRSAASKGSAHTRARRRLPKPRELMRARHPDYFSDTRRDDVIRFPRAIFEYHLDTLTNRKQEYQFEHFCRKLAEKRICPNLRVQTGPSGGGDSKVDTETYPVAKEIAERWWMGSPSAGVERWAFAFSAKKDWKSKFRADVRSIVSTARDYRRIYFFTNQFVSDKERAAEEDRFARDIATPIHIIDRAWIVDRVYEADRHDLEFYLAALGVEDVRQERTIRTGRLDTTRIEELEVLDRQIADPTRYRDAQYQLVEDCLRGAILVRSLERPRHEVEGRFVRTHRLAQDVDHRQQKLRIAYNRAWTAFWWYEEFIEFNRFYDIVEQLLKESILASDAELLLNLWMLLPTSAVEGWIDIEQADIERRAQRLATMLKKMAADSSRPNNSLQARTSLILMQTVRAHHSGRREVVESGWRDLSDVVDRSGGLGAYSVEHLFGLVKELGESVEGAAFDALYDKLANVVRQRRSDGEAGLAYLGRARQKMNKDKAYEAIEWFGRAEELLTKEEYREELVIALIGMSSAFEQYGLLWAARNKALAAADRALAPFVEHGQINFESLIALNRLVWAELRLGRIPHVLAALILARSVATHLNLSEDRKQFYADETEMQDYVLGAQFLSLPLTDLSRLSHLPSRLGKLGLDYARIALLFALGHEQVLREEGYFRTSASSREMHKFFERWYDQTAADMVVSRPMLIDGDTSELKSTILGTEVVALTPNDPTSFGIAESLLGALEALLSTCDIPDVFPFRERMSIVISASPTLKRTPWIKSAASDTSRIEVVHPTNLGFRTLSDRTQYAEWLRRSLVRIVSQMLVIPDVRTWLDKISDRERGFSRALALGDALTMRNNVFGDSASIHLADWTDRSAEGHAVLRDSPWRGAKPVGEDGSAEPLEFGPDSRPIVPIERKRTKHTDRRVLSPIDIPMWDRAKWRGILFLWPPDEPPTLAIAFEDGDSGRSIFRTWKERWGNEDKHDELRIAVITGVSNREPATYAVVIGPKLGPESVNEKKTVVLGSRIRRMSPKDSANLDHFVAAFKKTGRFIFAPARTDATGEILEMPSAQLAIVKWQLDRREAWQIGENDPDIAVFHKDDDPIVPAGVMDAPVNKALKRIRSAGWAMDWYNS